MIDTVIQALLVIPALIIAIVFHEVAHGWAALALGDPTARDLKRLSFNPMRHVDMVGTLLVPGALWLFGGPVFGWAKPVPVVKPRLRNPRVGMMLVAAAGPGMNLLLALLGAIVLGAGTHVITSAAWMFNALHAFIVINVFLAIFNLLPIPPFDGSHIVEGVLPRQLAPHWDKIRQLGMLFIIILVASSWAFPNLDLLGWLLDPPVSWMIEKYAVVSQWVFLLFS